MTNPEKKLLCNALDQLWGAVNAASEICEMVVDREDGRIEVMNRAISQAQDTIIDLREMMGVDK